MTQHKGITTIGYNRYYLLIKSIILNSTAIVKPSWQKNFHQDNVFGAYNSQYLAEFSPELFSSTYWKSCNAVTGTAQGRGTTWFIEHDKHQWVLRHYYRGGLIGKYIKDSYWFTSWEDTRAAREFALLAQLNAWQLPAPEPIAFKAVKRGLVYTADLLTQRIENSQDLVAILSQNKVDDALWLRIGEIIQRFHAHGVYHHDLNAHNILIDEKGDIWIIDFDRGEIRPNNTAASVWKNKNLARLERSFWKEKNKLPTFHWEASHWQLLLKGYQ